MLGVGVWCRGCAKIPPTLGEMRLFLFLAFYVLQVSTQSLPSCDSLIFCQGDLLHTVQMARLFNDSKTFVDMKLVNDEATTLANFQQLLNDTNQTPTRTQIKQFVDDNFKDYNEFDEWVPSDFNSDPEFLLRVEDETMRDFARDLVNIWPKLARKIKQEVLDSPELFSLLPLENGFIIPGGRFKEIYYWDSLWIVEGLLISEMYDTVKGVLNNFLSIVEKYGFIPNGSRIYYLNRSQPPFLNLMASLYVKATNDTEWLKTNINTLDKELRFWIDNRLVEVYKDNARYILAHYDAESGSPRPEAYYEDVTTAGSFSDENDKKQIYAELKTGAESGLDFTSRWFIDSSGGNSGNISFLHVRRIIPVDLNAYLCQAFHKISQFYVILDDYTNAVFWSNNARLWETAIQQVLYNEEAGIWYDWDNQLSQHRKYFFPTNFAPLWAEAHDPALAELLGQRAAEYFENQNITDFLGGVPASLSNTGEQWDYPNAWPPLQSIVVTGLDRSGNCKAKEIARDFAQRWVTSNWIGYNRTNEMFEKYDAEVPGQYGGGGEYVVQSGFGWTNGVVLEFIDRFFTTPKTREI